ncbi:hypothetical protein OsJ_03808 [Oryza sativa Japonica Group]|uniref:Uncharacterized protein n=1 Tax=Oryza sativa subsp. japonica TaxID=39947 RepID=A2ZYT4_ORYSJ|nr:hypothetical protein OsJ_03808 [Oryza sativa Japonica Group]
MAWLAEMPPSAVWGLVIGFGNCSAHASKTLFPGILHNGQGSQSSTNFREN